MTNASNSFLKAAKKYRKPKAKQPALTTARAVATRNIRARMPDNPTINVGIREEDKIREMIANYGILYNNYVANAYYDENNYFKNTVDTHRSEYTRGRMTQNAVDIAKELKNMPDMATFRAMDPEEQAKVWLRLREIIRDNEVKGTTYIRPELEHVRAQWIHTDNLSEEIKKYIRKGDLKTTAEFLRFLNLAKDRTGQYANMAYFIGMEDYYDDISLSRYSSEDKQLLAFIKFQLEFESDAKRRESILKKASNIKVDGHYVFTRKEIESYL